MRSPIRSPSMSPRLYKSLVGQRSSGESTLSPVPRLKRKRYSKNQWLPKSPPKPFSTKQRVNSSVTILINFSKANPSKKTEAGFKKWLMHYTQIRYWTITEREGERPSVELKKSQVKRMNKDKKICSLCLTHQTPKNKQGCINCFDCSCWCCYDCLSQAFKDACVLTTYSCFGCSSEDKKNIFYNLF